MKISNGHFKDQNISDSVAFHFGEYKTDGNAVPCRSKSNWGNKYEANDDLKGCT